MSYIGTITVGEARENHSKIPVDFIYVEKPLIILNDQGVVLWAGSLKEFHNTTLIKSGYYDKNHLFVREHDLFMNNNDKVSQYPECEKLDKCSDYIKGVLEFMEFANEKGIRLISLKREVYSINDLDFHKSEDLLYEMFGIDKAKLEKERNAMLTAFRG